jgi:signal transduction histidine kinase
MRLHLPRARLPRRTVRLRLTVLYGSLFLLCGTAVLAITISVAGAWQRSASIHITGSLPGTAGGLSVAGAAHGHTPPPAVLAEMATIRRLTRDVAIQAAEDQAAEARRTEIGAAVGLGITAVLSVAVGWLVAGRVLRPLRVMTATTRQISEDDLNQRLAMPGPDDELKDLADTIDGLLARLQAAFEAQQNFVASASHELRTPLTLSRTLLQLALTDPSPTMAGFRATCEEVLEAGEHSEQLIEALLTLARSQRGLDHREPADLGEIITETLADREPDAAGRGLAVTASVTIAQVLGDPRLLRRLAANLVDNAVRHNIRGGRVDVIAGTEGGAAQLKISNTGQVISPDQVAALLQPFQRLSGRTADDEGLGMGLPIIAAIAKAHGAALTINPRQHGGLHIEVTFPPVSSTERRDKELTTA